MENNFLYDYEDILIEELKSLIEQRKAQGGLSDEDICTGEKLLKSMEHIKRIEMTGDVNVNDAMEYDNMPDAYRAGRSYNGYNNRPSYAPRYDVRMTSSGYSNRRSGHNDEIRSEIEKRLSMAKNDNERAVLMDWLNEMNNR